MKPVFVMNAVIVRDNPSSTARNLREFGRLYHLKKGTRISWLLDYPTLEKRNDLKKAVMDFHEKYNDEITFFNYNDPIRWNQELLNKRIDCCMQWLSGLTGAYPSSIGSWLLNSGTVRYVIEKYGVHCAIGQVWEQLGVDGQSGVGSINGPYYPSRKHFLLPARPKEAQLDIVILDALSCDLIETCEPKTARTTLHPWDAHLSAFNAAAMQKHITNTYLKSNLGRNEFGYLNNTVELDWMYQNYLNYNRNHELKNWQTQWLEWLYNKFSGADYCTLSEFGRYFRAKHTDNSSLLYRFKQQSIFNPKRHCYWFFCQNYRACIEYSDAGGRPETIVLNASDFRPQGEWSDGYDTADHYHAGYPEQNTRTTAVLGRCDRTRFKINKTARYYAWILADGTEAADIEAVVDNAGLGIASGTRGSDDWVCLGQVRLKKGFHDLNLISRYNKKGRWFAVYAQIVLAADSEFKPPRGKLLKTDAALRCSDLTIYRAIAPKEPLPPAENWSLPSSGISWKLSNPATEIFTIGRNKLRISDPEYRGPATVLDRRSDHEKDGLTIARPRLLTIDDGTLRHEIRLTKLIETENETRLKFDISADGKVLLHKEIILSRASFRVRYAYKRNFDRLYFTDSRGRLKSIRPPKELVFGGGKTRVIPC